MKFAILVQGAPYASESCVTALHFAESVISQGHELVRVFFYEDGVLAATNLAAPPQDEIDIYARWQALAREHQVELVACIASCLRRGIIEPGEANRYDKPGSNLAEGFQISGLGQLIDAALTADRLVTFGA